MRENAERELDFESYKTLQKRLSKESQLESIQLKQMNHFWKEEIAKAQQKVNDFIQQQKKQDEMMRNFMDKMKNNLDESKSKPEDNFKKELETRH